MFRMPHHGHMHGMNIGAITHAVFDFDYPITQSKLLKDKPYIGKYFTILQSVAHNWEKLQVHR